jgi:hypothetical protein
MADQQMTSCVNSQLGYSSQGCTGGFSNDVFTYVSSRNLTTAALYPYTSGSAGVTGEWDLWTVTGE